MAVKGWRGTRSKLGICFVLALLTALLLGAGKMSQGIRERKRNRVAVQRDLVVLLSGVTTDIPEEHREQWKRNVNRNPFFFMRVNTSSLKRVSEGNLKYCFQQNLNEASNISKYERP